jgi:hypothetical protein
MTARWWRRNALALTAAPLVLGTAFWVAGRPLIDVWSQSDAPVRTVAIGEPFVWESGTFELRAVAVVPSPRDDDGDRFEPPPGTVVWRTAWRAGGPDAQTGAGCLVQLVDDQGRHFGADPAELNRLDVTRACTPDDDAGAADYRFVRYFLLPAGVDPAIVRFGAFDREVVAITLE